MSPRVQRNVCCACGKKRELGIRLHCFPKDAKRRLQWLENLNVNFLKADQVVCDDHFDHIYFGTKGYLMRTAVPRPINRTGEQIPNALLTETATVSGQEVPIDLPQTVQDCTRTQVDLPHYDSYYFGTLTEEAEPGDCSKRGTHQLHTQPRFKFPCDLPEASCDLPDSACDLPDSPYDLPEASCDLPEATYDLPDATSGQHDAPSALPETPVNHQTAPPSKLQKNRTPQIQLLQKTVNRLKRRIKQMELHNIKTPKQLLTKASHYLDPRMLDFFKWQVLHSVENESERKYGIEERSFALALYYQSPKTYKFLSSMFHLPPVQTLHSYLRTVSVNVGWSKHAISVLKNRASASPKEDTLCGIVFSSMGIKEGLHFDKVTNSIIGGENLGEHGGSLKQANRVLLFMVKGLVDKWTLVLGCFFYAGLISTCKLKELYEASIRKVQSTGHRVIFTVCDPEEEMHHSLFQTLDMTRENPSFELKGERIHFFYDSPYLLQGLTNTLLKYDMKIGGNVISWNHIKQFIERDQKQKIRLAPKLTSDHVCGDSNSEIGVSTATQVMSHIVAAGIFTHSVSGMLPQEAVHTAEFVQQVHSLFFQLNNSHILQLEEVVGGASSKSRHRQLISDITTYLTSLEVCAPPDVQTHCVDGWLINLASLQAICQELSTYNVKCLLTSQLNHDCLKSIFVKLRDEYEEGGHLTAHNFLKGLKSIITNNLIEVTKSGNCDIEDSHYLDISLNWESEFPFLPSDSDSESEEFDEDYDNVLL